MIAMKEKMKIKKSHPSWDFCISSTVGFPQFFLKKTVPPTKFFENLISHPFRKGGVLGDNYAWYNLDQAERTYNSKTKIKTTRAGSEDR